MNLTKFFKENLVLCCGIALPVFMMAVFFLITGLQNPPQPKYDFILSTHAYYNGSQSPINAYLYVQNGQLYASYTVPPRPDYREFPKLYIYEVATRRLRQLDFFPPNASSVNGDTRVAVDATKTMMIDASPTAPDGYQFTYNSDDSYNGGLIGDLIIGGGSYNYGPKLKNHSAIIPLDLSSPNNQFEFVGWVVGSRP